MTITREWEFCGDLDTTTTHTSLFSTTAGASMSNTRAFTGTYSLMFPANYSAAAGHGTINVSASRQKRIGMRVYTANSYIVQQNAVSWFSVHDGGGNSLIDLYWWQPNSVQLYVGGVAKTAAGVMGPNRWWHVGVDFKIDSSAGWVKVYVDGVEVISATGNTGNADVVSVTFGCLILGYYTHYVNDAWFSDMFVDDTAGEGAAAVVPGSRFYKSAYAADGDVHTWTCSTGTDHKALIDDVPNNGATDYNVATTDAVTDLFTHATYTSVVGETPKAVLPYALVQNVDAGVACKIAGVGRDAADTDQVGDFVLLPSTYAYRRSRLLTLPDASALSDAGINACQYGYKSYVP